LQKFINHSDWDLRILIVGDKAFSIKRQRAGHWLTNISQGAIGSPYSPNASELALARAAAKATGCVIAGVDIFYERHTEKPMVCDVNAAPGWQGTANTLGADIGQAILDVVSATQP